MASPAAAAPPSPQSGAEIRNVGGSGLKQSGGGTNAGGFTLRLPSGAACPGDAVSGGWTWTAYMSLSSPTSFTGFDSNGPTPQGFGTSFTQALRDPSGNPIVGQAPNVGDGAIINIPNVSFSSFNLGDFDTTATRVYNVGIACVNSGALDKFWNVQMTVTPDTTAAGGTPQIHWENGTKPSAPVLNTVTPGNGSASVGYTPPTGSNPALTNCHIAAGTTPGFTTEAASVNSAACASPVTVPGLTNGTAYYFHVYATNAVGNSVISNEGGPVTPKLPSVSNLQASPDVNKVTLTWDTPASAPASYTVEYCKATALGTPAACTASTPGDTVTTYSAVGGATQSDAITGLTGNQLYLFMVSYGASNASQPASVYASPNGLGTLVDDITATRPAGGLVLTQVCGVYNALADNGGAATGEPPSTGFPGGFTAADDAASTGTPSGPTLSAGGSDTDPAYTAGQYPYPENPDGTPNVASVTHCGLPLGTAKFVRTGAGKGTGFATSARLNQVSVVDTTDADTGWDVSFIASTFNGPAGESFGGNQVGWNVATSQNAPFSYTDGTGATQTYTQTVTHTGADIVEGTTGAAGAGNPRIVASAPAGHGLGIGKVDARVKLLIPVTANHGTYTGTLTITALSR